MDHEHCLIGANSICEKPLKYVLFLQIMARKKLKWPNLANLIGALSIAINERVELTRFQHLKLTHLLCCKAPSRAVLI